MSSALVEHETRVDTAPTANILLVDDNPIKLLALESALAGLEQHVSKARSADEVLRCLVHQDFAVILLDVNMPGMGGFELAERIRRCERSCHTLLYLFQRSARRRSMLFKATSWALSITSRHQH